MADALSHSGNARSALTTGALEAAQMFGRDATLRLYCNQHILQLEIADNGKGPEGNLMLVYFFPKTSLSNAVVCAAGSLRIFFSSCPSM